MVLDHLQLLSNEEIFVVVAAIIRLNESLTTAQKISSISES